MQETKNKDIVYIYRQSDRLLQLNRILMKEVYELERKDGVFMTYFNYVNRKLNIILWDIMIPNMVLNGKSLSFSSDEIMEEKLNTTLYGQKSIVQKISYLKKQFEDLLMAVEVYSDSVDTFRFYTSYSKEYFKELVVSYNSLESYYKG